MEQLLLDLGYQVLIGLVIGGICFLAGLVVENAFDLINGRKKEERLKERVRQALDCVFEAEEEFRGAGRGKEKLEWAVRRYQERAGVRKYEEALAVVTQMFMLSKLNKE